MLRRVLHEMQLAQGTLRLDELAVRMDMQPSALKGMIDFWVGKGRLRLVGEDEAAASCVGSCGSKCTGVSTCPFVAQMPVMYALDNKPAAVTIDLGSIH